MSSSSGQLIFVEGFYVKQQRLGSVNVGIIHTY